MTEKVNLHAHDRVGAGDSSATTESMVNRYAAMGYEMIGLVGHDSLPGEIEDPPIRVLRGIEHEVQTFPARVHVIEYPEVDFSFLCHPRWSWPAFSKKKAEAWLADHDVDGVEKYNGGTKQYDGHIEGYVELACDDSHNPWQCGSSYMVGNPLDSQPELENRPLRLGRKAAGKFDQAVALASKMVGDVRHR